MNLNKLFLYVVIIAFYGCKKNSDEKSPVIILNSPGENSYHQIPNTIGVTGKVSDETKLVSVTIQITYESGGLILPSQNIPVESNEMEFSAFFNVTDVHLPTGYYYVKVSARDEKNMTSRYVRIRLLAVPRTLEKVLVLTNSNTNGTMIAEWNSGITPVTSFMSDFKWFSVSSWHRQFMVAGDETGDLKVFDANTGNLIYTIQNQNTAASFFQRASYSDFSNRLITGCANSMITGYNQNGTATLAMNLNSGLLPLCYCEYDDKIAIGYKNPIGNQHYFSTWYKSQNTIISNLTVNFTPKEIYLADQSTLIVFSNENTNGKISYFDLNSGTFTNHSTVPSNFSQVIRAGEITWLMATSDGIWYHDFTTGNTGSITTIPAFSIAYDDISGTIYSAEGYSVKTYSIQNGAMLNSANFADSVKAIGLVFTR